MKKSVIALMSIAFLSSAFAVDLQTDEQKAFYALGFGQGKRIEFLELSPAELNLVMAGIKDGVSGKESLVDLQAAFPTLEKISSDRVQAATEKNKKEGKDYIAKAAKEKGAKKLEEGLIFVETEKGKGPSPKETDTVKVHYEGTFINGKVFDSSIKRGEPAEFGLNQVIPCWTKAVQKMRTGSKAKVVCGPDLAYGDGGVPPAIPGGSTLIFNIELLDVTPAKDAK